LKALTDLTAEEIQLMKWIAHLNVEDEDLSLITVCFHHYCYLLKN